MYSHLKWFGVCVLKKDISHEFFWFVPLCSCLCHSLMNIFWKLYYYFTAIWKYPSFNTFNYINTFDGTIITPVFIMNILIRGLQVSTDDWAGLVFNYLNPSILRCFRDLWWKQETFEILFYEQNTECLTTCLADEWVVHTPLHASKFSLSLGDQRLEMTSLQWGNDISSCVMWPKASLSLLGDPTEISGQLLWQALL